jgi:hypothetical protein
MKAEFYVLDTTDAAAYRLYAGGQCVNCTLQRCRPCGVLTETPEPPEIEIALNHLGRQGFTEHLWGFYPMFRQDLIELWRNTGLTGFETRPVHIVGWHESPRKPLPTKIPTYHRLITTSRVRLTEPKVMKGPCPVCGFIEYKFPKTGTHLRNGLRADPSSWDGSDFFGLLHYDFVFCTRRVAEVTLKARHNRHIAFVRMENWERWDEFDVRKWTPKAYQEHIESFLIRKLEDL